MATKDITDAQVCQAVADYQAQGLPFGLERLQRMTGQPEKVCYRAMERAEGRRLLDSGVSLRSAWLTDAGRAMLADGVKEVGRAD